MIWPWEIIDYVCSLKAELLVDIFKNGFARARGGRGTCGADFYKQFSLVDTPTLRQGGDHRHC